MNADVRLFKLGEMDFADYGDGPGSAGIVRLVGPDTSKTMGAYLGRFDGRSVPWTVRYDEVIACISGHFRLWTQAGSHELGPGDVIWIGEGTELRYEGEDAVVFMAIAPVDWRSRSANQSA